VTENEYKTTGFFFSLPTTISSNYPNNMPERSQKAWVRKHQSSYWSVWFGKDKDKKEDDKGKGKKARQSDHSSTTAQQGSEHGQADDGGFDGT
jgi:hypothetical protein